MEWLTVIGTRFARWLAYADFCLNNEEQLARCQPFWGLVTMILGFFCVAAAAGVIVKMIRDRRKGPAGYRKPK
jgi:hypothetical protein